MTATPLLEEQLGVWYAQRLAPDSPAFNTGQVLFLEGRLDVAALERAVAMLGAEAEALRLRFDETPQRPCQIAGAPAPQLAHRSLEGADDAAAMAAFEAEARVPFDLAAGPAAAFTLWRLGPSRHALTQKLHHLIADGYANLLVTNRLAALYGAQAAGRDPGRPLAPLSRRAEADAAWQADPRRAAERDWWHARLDGMGAVGSPSGQEARPAGPWFHRSELALPPGVSARLCALAERAGIGWPDALTALCAAYLARFSPDRDCVPGIPLMNRMGPKAARVLASLVNILPWRAPLDPQAPLPDWLAAAGADLALLRRHGRYRGESLRRETGRLGGGRRLYGPLINVLPFEPCPRIEGLDTRLEILGAGAVEDMTICFRGTGVAGLRLQVDTNPGLYCAAATAAHAERLRAFLTAAAGAERLADLPSLTPAEHRAHVETRNRTAHPVPATTLAALIAQGLAEEPERPAVVFGDTVLSRAELDRRSLALAADLAARGAGPGTRVAVALPRSADLIVALLGVLRAGAAYVPLDPEDRSARSRDMLERAAPELVLAERGYAPDGLPVLSPADWPAAPRQALPAGPAPDDPAYLLYTSGSTGRPKGVVVSHDAIVNRLLWMRDAYAIGAGDRILQKTPATFDVSVWEFFLPAISGATLVVAPPGAHRDPRALAGLIRQAGVTVAHFVPSMLALFLDVPEARGLRLRHVFASGEALPADLARAFHERIAARLHNLYGPTEAAVDVTFREATGTETGASVPIGRPVWNTRTYVLDDALRPVPDGVPGRLFLAGRQLAQGYHGQPELTAERFLPDPFHPGERMYDTGDIVTADATGALTYLGRADGQVKLNGVRIETGEIEAAALATGTVRQAAAGLWQDAAGSAHLTLWAVPAPGEDAASIRRALTAALPPLLQPGLVACLDALPLSPSGKLDRRALPAPSRTVAARRGLAAGTETLLGRLYGEILGLSDPAGPRTDFFAAGGDSLAAMRLCLAIETETGRDPGLGTLIETPVLSDLARRLDRQAAADHGLGPVLRLPGAGPGTVIAVHPAGGLGWCYRALARELPGLRVIALQSPLLDPGRPDPQSLSQLAADYADLAEDLVPEGPVSLIGWSLGGIIAHAMAAEFEARGRDPGRLCLLDAYPSECWRNEPEPDDGAALRAILAVAGFDPEAHRDLQDVAAVLGFLAARGHPLAALPPQAAAGVIRAVRATNRLVRGHREPVIRGTVRHVHARLEHLRTGFAPDLWLPYCGRLETLSLECHHREMIAPAQASRIASFFSAPATHREAQLQTGHKIRTY
ncbi:non-ribosomal peptide synthetase [Mangrovicoccus algicola]|uniref:Amino acid adenylation domain-containing protein n=1 Tax=Mangrovicoccus algicola TaxID=2771008 RepID=A0A8J7CZ24_9RHOB|nr:non-ribosomal peptide synthetase [Mangrovicoccus algicola]MBE3637273.1 amino acid adenylation domain-containing protein [Mangrovicoccus algicola]